MHGWTASAAFDANDPEPTCAVQNFCSAKLTICAHIAGRKFLL